VDNNAQRLKVIMATLVVLHKVVPVSMYDKKTAEQKLVEVASQLILDGYMVQKITCGECDQDDLLIQVHTCNPHNYTHNCTPKRKS
jgi:uncharacterized protein YqhQ